MRRRLLGRVGLVILLSPLASWLSLSLIGALAPQEIRFDVGPNTGTYLRGFTESEERPPVSFRWSGERAFINLPLRAAGSGHLELRLARFLPGNARVHWSTNGKASPAFDVRSGRFRTIDVELGPAEGDSLSFELVVEDGDPSRLGVSIDWLRVRGLRLSPDFSRLAAWSAPLLLFGIVGIGAVCRLGVASLVASAGFTILATTSWFHLDPMGMMHSLPLLVIPGLLLAILAASRLGGRSGAWLAGILLLALIARGAILMHPSYFYPDVRNHRRYVTAFNEAEGGWVAKGIAAQRRVQTAYPRKILGEDYALPYSPIYFVPFSLIRGERAIEQALKMVSLLLATLEIPLIFLAARRLFGIRAALVTAAILAVFPPMTSRLTLAMFPTIAGHLFEMVTLVAALIAGDRLARPKRLLGYAGAGLLASLTYVSSLINLSVFTLMVAAGMGRRGLRLLGAWTLVGLTTVGLLYMPFMRVVWSEILPRLRQPVPLPETPVTEGVGISFASILGRIPLFYGWPVVILALLGGWLAWRAGDESRRWLAAFVLTAVALLTLRAVSFGLFKDLKEILFAAPLAALLAARGIEGLVERGRIGRLAGLAAMAAVMVFCLQRLATEFLRLTQLAGSG